MSEPASQPAGWPVNLLIGMVTIVSIVGGDGDGCFRSWRLSRSWKPSWGSALFVVPLRPAPPPPRSRPNQQASLLHLLDLRSELIPSTAALSHSVCLQAAATTTTPPPPPPPTSGGVVVSSSGRRLTRRMTDCLPQVAIKPRPLLSVARVISIYLAHSRSSRQASLSLSLSGRDPVLHCALALSSKTPHQYEDRPGLPPPLPQSRPLSILYPGRRAALPLMRPPGVHSSLGRNLSHNLAASRRPVSLRQQRGSLNSEIRAGQPACSPLSFLFCPLLFSTFGARKPRRRIDAK